MKWVIKITRDINKLRDEIDKTDKKIIELILNRMNLVHEVGLTKAKNNSRVYVPEREVAIYKKLSAFSGISPKEIQSFYTEIISFCRKLEDILNVGIQMDSLCLLGIKKIFGEYVNPIIVEDFNELELSSTKYILAPLSKSTLDFILKNNWSIINSVKIENETLYLFSCYENVLIKNGDIQFILYNKIISKNYIEFDNNIFINLIPYDELNSFKNLNIKILGFVPSI